MQCNMFILVSSILTSVSLIMGCMGNLTDMRVSYVLFLVGFFSADFDDAKWV
jgi:hypothetical protein